MDFIKGLWRDLRARPVDTLVRWQEQRFLWLLMAIAMGGLIIWRTRSSNLPLHGTVRAVCLHPLRDVCDGNWRGDCGDKSQKYRAEADWLHRGVLWQHYGH